MLVKTRKRNRKVRRCFAAGLTAGACQLGREMVKQLHVGMKPLRIIERGHARRTTCRFSGSIELLNIKNVAVEWLFPTGVYAV
jgi:hypothetical protein